MATKETQSAVETTTIKDQPGCSEPEARRATAPPIRKETAAMYTLSDIFLYVAPFWGLLTIASIIFVLSFIKP